MGRRRWSAALGFHLIAAMLFAADADGFRPRPHDWPQWRGPNRTAVSTERGLLQEWPAAGPTLAWKAMNLGRGYATPSVAAGRVFTLGERGGNLFVTAVSEGSGVELWSSNLGGPWKGEGPNSTPTVDGERLYVILPQGELVCLEVATGRERWRRNLTKDFAARFPGRGMSESALVDGDKVVCTPGGEMATLVALDKHSGKTIWQAQVPERDRAGYTSAIVADAAGRRRSTDTHSRNHRPVCCNDQPPQVPSRAQRHRFGASHCGTGGGAERRGELCTGASHRLVPARHFRKARQR